MIGNHQYGIANGHSSSLLAPTGSESAVLSGQVSVPRTTGGMRRLDESCPQPGIALGGFPASAFAPALVVARTHPRPRSQVPIGGEAAHVRADLGQYCLRRTPSHSRDRLQSLNCFSERAHPLSNLRTQLFDGLLEEVDVRQLLSDEEALVRSGTSPNPTVTLVRNGPLNTACRTLIEESSGCEDDQAALQGAENRSCLAQVMRSGTVGLRANSQTSRLLFTECWTRMELCEPRWLEFPESQLRARRMS